MKEYPHLNVPMSYQTQVVRFNYKPEEKVALVEFLAIVKGLAAIMLKEDALLSPILRHCIHDEIQEYIQIHLRELIRHATSKKKKELRSDLMQLRFIAADWHGTEPQDPALQGKKSSDKDFKPQFSSRSVGPSPTQLELIRNVTFGLLQKQKDVPSKYVKTLEDFYHRSFFYGYLLNYTGNQCLLLIHPRNIIDNYRFG